MPVSIRIALAAVFLFLHANAASAEPGPEELRHQVMETERAFEQTMADRDFEAFGSFLDREAIFFSGSSALRGKEQVEAAWKAYFESPDAPFSWEPAVVEVLDSGTLALSSGPVRDPEGNCAGMYNSIWRLESPGRWKIIFDKGSSDCEE